MQFIDLSSYSSLHTPTHTNTLPYTSLAHAHQGVIMLTRYNIEISIQLESFVCVCLDEDELLEQMIKDTEALALEEDMSTPEEPEEEIGGGQGAETSSGVLLDEFLVR